MKVYGPYTRKDGRQHVILYDGKIRKTVSYPKYLVEQALNTSLDDDETVDHIDGNFSNNDFSNLRIVKRTKHCHEDSKTNIPLVLTCVWCGDTHTQKINHVRSNAKQGKAGPFCSKSCRGQYGSAVQNGKIKPFPPQTIPEHPGYVKPVKQIEKTVADLLEEKPG